MSFVKLAMLLVGAGLASSGIPASLAADDVPEEKMELAREVAELQRTRDFFQLQWDVQKKMMLEGVPREHRNAQMKSWMNVMRQELVEGQAEAWVGAIAAEVDTASLRAAANVLDNSDLQAWIAHQLKAYPGFLERMNERQQAAASVMADGVGGMDKRKERMAEIAPIGDSRLGTALGLAPGARVDAEISNPFAADYRFPVADEAIAEVLPDLSAELLPGPKGAHVISISGTRAYASQSACEAARGKLVGTLSVHFPETDVNDCGTESHLNADRTVRMRARCQAQDTGDSVLLELDITHLPTMEAAYGTMEAEPTPDVKSG